MIQNIYQGQGIVVTVFSDGKDFGAAPAVEITDKQPGVRRVYYQDYVVGCHVLCTGHTQIYI
jgi:hypothetical protein